MQSVSRPALGPKRIATPVALAIVALLSFLPAHAQVDTSEWKCEFCPFASGYDASVDVGASYVSDDAFRFGNATGYDQAGGYAELGGEGHYANDGYQLNWFAEDLGLDSRVFEVDAGRQGRYGVYLGYRELPYRRYDSTGTVYTAASADSLTLPANWVPATNTAGFTALATSLMPVNIESDRTEIDAGGHLLATSNFRLYADYRHLTREGVDIVSGANFTQSSLLPRMLDFETDLVDVGIGYAHGPFSVSLSWFGSFFTNNLSSLTWENAFTSPAGEEQRRLAQEPDNDFQQLSLSGNYHARTLDTVIAFSAALGQGTQDELLLPYTINPNVVAGALPVSSLDGKVDTTNYALTLTSRPLPKTRVKLAYRYDERDNQTAQSTWSRVIVDSFASGDSELNTPYSFERSRLTASGSYDLFDSVRVSAGYDRTTLDRDFQEVAQQTEDSGWGRILWHATAWLDINAKGGASKRDIDRYDTSVAGNLGQNPLLRKYNLAYRYREFGELTVSVAPLDSPISVGLFMLWADDSYNQSLLGMTSSETAHWNVDLGWTISDRASIYAFVGQDSIDAEQAGSENFAAADWTAVHEDDFSVYGGGLRLNQISEKTNVRLDFTHTAGETAIAVNDALGGQGAFPDLESDLDSLKLTLNYMHSERLNVDLSLRYESFMTSDWAISGVQPDTIPNVLSLGEDPYDYDVWVLGVSFRYLIGGVDPASP